HVLVHVVTDIDDGNVELAVQPLDERHDLGLARFVERRERLVHQEDAGLRQQRAADRDALFIAAGQIGGPPVEQRAEPKQGHQRIELDLVPTVPRAIEEIAAHREMGEQPRLLKDIADAALLGRRVEVIGAGVQRLAFDNDPPDIGLHQPGDGVDQRGFAGAGTAIKRDDARGRGGKSGMELKLAEPLLDGDLNHAVLPLSRAKPDSRSAIRSSISSRPMWRRIIGPASHLVAVRNRAGLVGTTRLSNPPQLAPMPNSSSPSIIASTAGLAKSRFKVKLNRPLEPAKSRFQMSWPGQSGRAGCSTRSTSGRVLSQCATFSAAFWCARNRTPTVRSPRSAR